MTKSILQLYSNTTIAQTSSNTYIASNNHLMTAANNPTGNTFDKSNENLFALIPVIYGAVFSYSMYIFSNFCMEAYNEWHPFTFNGVLNSNSLKKIALFMIFTAFMIEQVGSMMKLGVSYPFRKASRYTLEIFIALLYVCTFSLLSQGVFHCTNTFALLTLIVGIWYHQFKDEYKNHESNVTIFAKNERDLYFICAGILALGNGIFMANKYFLMSWLNIFIFILVVVSWMVISSMWACKSHGEKVMKCKVMIFLTYSYCIKISNKNQLS